jgi:5'-3' exonuclease
MILLIDADSMVFASCYKQREYDEDTGFHTDITEAFDKFHEQVLKVIGDIEDMYDVDEAFIFNGSKGNFRKLITRKYKANRKKNAMPPLLNELHDMVKKEFDSIYRYGVETDDVVASWWKTISDEIGRENVMIVSIDKDYRQFPCLLYNYHPKHRSVEDISPEQAKFNFYAQMIMGDAADNVNYFKGKGKVFAYRYLNDCVTDYQYRRRVFELFKHQYKSKAREKYIECYSLLKLRTE